MVAAGLLGAGAGAGDISLGAAVVLNLSSGAGLRGTLAILGSTVLGLALVVVGLVNGDGTGDLEGSLSDLALLGLRLAVALGLRNLSLIGDGVLVGDDDVLSTDLSLGAGGLGGELSVSTSAVLSTEDGLSGTTSAADGEVSETSTVGVTGGLEETIAAAVNGLDFSDLAGDIIAAGELGGGGSSKEGNNSELHLILNRTN